MYNVVYPKAIKTKLITRLGFDGFLIWAKLQTKNDDWTAITKSFNLKWNWDTYRRERRLNDLTGNVQNRLAELGMNLIIDGFPVEFPDDKIKQIALDQSWKSECKKWILDGKNQYDGWLRIFWRYEAGDFYTRAKMIDGAKYDSITKCICVPAENFEEVLGFAEIHNFQIHKTAKIIIEKQKELLLSSIVINAKINSREIQSTKKVNSFYEVKNKFVDFMYLPEIKTVTSLFDYQNSAVNKMLKLTVGALFMDMGLGKTRCAIELVKIRQQRINKIVYFCPVSLKVTAQQEILKHTNCSEDNICLVDSSSNFTHKYIWYIVGIESISISDNITLKINKIIDKNTFVIVDESSYIKTHNAIRTKRIIRMCRDCKYKLIMTGTPISEGYENLYSQMKFLNPEILGYNSFYSFSANHLEYHPDYPNMVIAAHNTRHLVKKIEPYIYQIKKADALTLPEKIYETRYCYLTQQQKEYYQQAKEEILLNNNEILESYIIFQLFGALQQIVSGFWNRENEIIEIPHNRLEILHNIIDEIPNKEQIIIWCKYIYSVQQISDLYKNDSVVYYGQLTQREKKENLQLWKSGNKRILIATISSGGYGLTLTNARYSVFYENEFSYADRLQSEDRNHRIGQDQQPVYISLYAVCGIERRIEQALNKKENVVGDFLKEIKCQKDI